MIATRMIWFRSAALSPVRDFPLETRHNGGPWQRFPIVARTPLPPVPLFSIIQVHRYWLPTCLGGYSRRPWPVTFTWEDREKFGGVMKILCAMVAAIAGRADRKHGRVLAAVSA